MIVASHHLEPTVTIYVHGAQDSGDIAVAVTSLLMCVSLTLSVDAAEWLATTLQIAVDQERSQTMQ